MNVLTVVLPLLSPLLSFLLCLMNSYTSHKTPPGPAHLSATGLRQILTSADDPGPGLPAVGPGAP